MNIVKTGLLLAAMTAIFMGAGYLIGGPEGSLVALAIAAATNLWAWWGSDRAVLRMHNAVQVDEQSAPEFVAIVRQLSENAGLPMPAVYVLETDQPNAFATGRNPQNAAVAASRGLLERLSAEEVAAVMAHELAHIENRDTLTMTITATLAGAISFLGSFAFFFRGDGRSPFGALGYIVALIVAPLAATIVQMAISRTREYAADRRGAEICGNPSWLASALRKIAEAAGRIVNVEAERQPASAHMFIVNPLSGMRMDNLFSTHPDTGNRIRALQEMQAEIAQTSMPQLGRDEQLDRGGQFGRGAQHERGGRGRDVPQGHAPGASDAGTDLWGRETRRDPPVAPGRQQRRRPRGPWAGRDADPVPENASDTPPERTRDPRNPWSPRDRVRDAPSEGAGEADEALHLDPPSRRRNPWRAATRRAPGTSRTGKRNPWR